MTSHPYAEAAVAGAFNTAQARSLPGHTSLSIALEAAKGVAADAGIDVGDIDGVFGSYSGEICFALGLDSVSSCVRLEVHHTEPQNGRPVSRGGVVSPERGERPMKVSVDNKPCTGHGRCMAAAPGVYVLDEVGFNQLGTLEVAPDAEESARKGAAACPEDASYLTGRCLPTESQRLRSVRSVGVHRAEKDWCCARDTAVSSYDLKGETE